MRPTFNQFRESLLAIFIFALLFLFSATLMFGQQEARVVIKGQISAPETDGQGAWACLKAVNGEEMDVVVRGNGKFWINAPEAERYTLQFSQNGCMTKEVVVDAHHASKSVSAKKDRVILFDVVLHEDDTQGELRYDGPVGRVDFHKSNGRMKVAHHYQLVDADAPPLIAGGPKN